MDIEKAIVILKDEDCFWNSPEKDILEAIKHILAEREADKKKIKELEDHLKKYYNGELYTAKQLKQIEENQKKYFIPVQKVKDKIENLRYNSSLGFEETLEESFKIEALEEILEEK